MLKKIVNMVLFAVFLVLSSLYISPKAKESVTPAYSLSGQLTSRLLKDGNTERIDFIDNNGRIAMDPVLGYATVVITKTNYGRLESYYDVHGEPVIRSSGYAAIRYEYDNHGAVICIGYLGKDGEPVTIRNGYATEKREYNDKGQMTRVRYYDIYGRPACFTYLGYGKILEYDENGYPYRTIYTDESGKPMMTREGYAIIIRKYYLSDGPENGRVESETYYDTNGDPVSLRTGEYGLHREYDEAGRAALLTYLDADGRPMIISKGYATVRRTFFFNDQIASERYYDQNGAPCRLPEGQYGFMWRDGKQVYLDENGNEQRSLRNLLFNQSWLVIAIALLAVVLTVLAGKRVNFVLLALCILTIIYLTLIARSSLTTTSGIKIVATFIRMFFDAEARADVLKNIWLFIPLGAILYRISPGKSILFIPLLLSGTIEAVQLFTRIGYCDLIDLGSNGLGGLIGFTMAEALTETVNRIRKPKK